MRRLLVLILLLGVTGVALAADPGNRNNKADVWEDNGDHGRDGREGGETLQSAVVIPALPFNDTGATCDNVDNYDEECPYTGSTSADVVYAYTPAANEPLTLDLCASAYDTKLYVYAGSPGNLIACNDDAGCGYSGYQSKLENVTLNAGVTYYIVIDGYGGACGSYALSIESYGIGWCYCPPGTLEEGEPPCVDGYQDTFNGGCNSSGWTLIQEQGDHCATLCGQSCTYLYQGSSYRDTDWYQLFASGGTVTARCGAQFPVQIILIWGIDCDNLQYDYTQGGSCQEVTLTRDFEAGAEFWFWVGPSVFNGIPESDYIMEICGIAGGATATQERTWGAVKNHFR